MLRKARITIPEHVHHVMSRRMEARPIFRSHSDRELLKSLIGKNIDKSGYLLYAWCFMDNHYHLVVRINNYPLAMFMRSINGPYAQYFRKRIKTRGYLFQDRYKSIVCQDQNYLQELVRYVHLNPVRGGICETIRSLRNYKWCGHSVVMGLQTWNTQNCSDVLKRFGKNIESSRINYELFYKKLLKMRWVKIL
jgi:REP element-mobilizing transposase RayT